MRIDRFGDPLPDQTLATLGTTRFWDGSRSGLVQSLAFSPDGKRLASGGQDTTVLTWDVAAWI